MNSLEEMSGFKIAGLVNGNSHLWNAENKT